MWLLLKTTAQLVAVTPENAKDRPRDENDDEQADPDGAWSSSRWNPVETSVTVWSLTVVCLAGTDLEFPMLLGLDSGTATW